MDGTPGNAGAHLRGLNPLQSEDVDRREVNIQMEETTNVKMTGVELIALIEAIIQILQETGMIDVLVQFLTAIIKALVGGTTPVAVVQALMPKYYVTIMTASRKLTDDRFQALCGLIDKLVIA
jgi:hypothetical protein